MSYFKIIEHSKIQYAYPQWSTVEETIKNFEYEHNLVFGEMYYNEAFEIEKGVWKMLKLTDPITFEYRTITTDIKFYVDYKSSGYPLMSKIIISTIDDAHMSLWMKNRDEDSMSYFIRYFADIPMLHSCEFEYDAFVRRFSYLISNKEIIEISFN